MVERMAEGGGKAVLAALEKAKQRALKVAAHQTEETPSDLAARREKLNLDISGFSVQATGERRGAFEEIEADPSHFVRCE